MRLAIIVPVLNEEGTIEAALLQLAPLRARGARVIVVDGGSDDGTLALAARHADAALCAPRGRSLQMNAGAARSLEEPAVGLLLFLHADTHLPPDADRKVAAACAGRTMAWGRFDVRIDGRHMALPLIAAMMNLRSRLSGICTGDQCLFATRALFERLGGFAPIPLMEDIDFSRRARRVQWPITVSARAVTSGRRWERHGVVRTMALMWRLRLAYYCGVDPAQLARAYRDAR